MKSAPRDRDGGSFDNGFAEWGVHLDSTSQPRRWWPQPNPPFPARGRSGTSASSRTSREYIQGLFILYLRIRSPVKGQCGERRRRYRGAFGGVTVGTSGGA